jgi:S1-C subfamily serine protease
MTEPGNGGWGWPEPAAQDGPAWLPPGPSAAAGGHGSFTPPPPPPPPGWWNSPPPPAGAPLPPSRPRRAAQAAVVAGVVGLAAVAGLGIGHVVWPERVVAAGSAQANTGSGDSGSAQNGSSAGQSPFGSAGSSDQSPFGSFGSGSSPSGSSGSGDSSGGSPFDFGNSSGGGSGSSGSSADTSGIAAKVSPALVDINCTFGYQSAQGAGTGIVLTANGEILTNNHVINGATKISVTDIGNGQTYSATVTGYDAAHDVAVLQLQGASGLQTASLGDSSKAAVGDSIVAIGNAGGTGGTPSSAAGSITALDQAITAGDDLNGSSEQLSGLIQVNANIQPGDSGGSLVNSAGQVIGIDTAAGQGFTLQTAGSEGYAIPINEARAIAKQIESGRGSSTTHVGATALLGVGFSSSGQNDSGSFFGTDPAGGAAPSTSGATVGNVLSGGPAAQAGLAAGDTIMSLDGQSVDSPATIAAALVGHHPGDKVQVGWVDSSGQSHTATVDLGSGPPA